MTFALLPTSSASNAARSAAHTKLRLTAQGMRCESRAMPPGSCGKS